MKHFTSFTPFTRHQPVPQSGILAGLFGGRFIVAAVAMLFFIAMGTTAWGQLLTENFTFTGNLTANGWTAHSGAGTNAIASSATALSYSGYAGSGNANSASLTTSGEDVNRTFTTQTSGAVYAAFLANISATQATGDYFFHFAENPLNTAILKARVFAKTSGAGYVLGIQLGSSGVVYGATVYTLSTTHLIVVKYLINSGTLNDQAFLFVDPTPGSAEPAATVTATDVSTGDINPGSIALRQGTAANAATLKIAGIRVGTTWEDATALGELLVEENFAYSIGQLTSAAGGANVSGGNWVSFSGAGNYIPVGSGSLSYTGYASSGVGNKITTVNAASSAEDVYRQFPLMTTLGTVYVSFLYKATDVSTIPTNSSTAGDYPVGVATITTSFLSRVVARQGTVPGKYQLGVRAAGPATSVFYTTDLDTGATYLVVLKHEMNSGNANDVGSIWVNPTIGGSEPAANATQTSTTATDSTTLARVFVRQANSGAVTTPAAVIDGFRVGKSWEVVTGTATAPTVTTNAATSIASVSATLNGTVNAKLASTTVTFEYGTTVSYGSTVTADQSPVIGNTNQAVSKSISGLLSNTTYHFRVVGTNNKGTANGSDQTFTTSSSIGSEIVSTTFSIPTAISFQVDTKPEEQPMFQFKVRDDGQTPGTDALGTIVTSARVVKGSGNTVPDWSAVIQEAALYRGATQLAIATLHQDSLTWTGAPLFVVDDNFVDSFTVKVYLKTPLPAGSGGKRFEFKINQNTNVTTSGAGSQMGAGGTSVVGSPGTAIDVTASAGTYKVAGPINTPKTSSSAVGDTLYWDLSSTWVLVSGITATGVPSKNDTVILDHTFRAGKYTVAVGPTNSDSAKQIIVGYVGNPDTVTLLIPSPSSASIVSLAFGDGVAGNYDFVVSEKGVVRNCKLDYHTSMSYKSTSDSIWIRTGGLWYHATNGFNTVHRILSRRFDGDYGTIEFDVPTVAGMFFDISGGGNYWYPHVVLSNTQNAQTYYWFGTGATTIKGNLTVNPGAKDSMMLTPYPFLVYGNIINNGTIIATTSPLVFAGSSTQTVSGSNPMDLGSGLVTLNPNGVNLLTNVNVTGGTVQTTGTFTYDSTGGGVNATRSVVGTINTGTSTVYLNPAGNMNEGDNPVQGNVSATRTASQSSNQTFGDIGFQINAAGGAPGSTTILRKTGVASTGNGNPSIKRYFDVTPTNNVALNATLVFFYAESELNSIPEADLLLHKSTNSGTTWSGQTGTVDALTNKITAGGVQSFSRWTAASKNAPLFVPHTITIRKFKDTDGDFATSGDRTAKKWRLYLYKDSVASSTLQSTGNPTNGVLTTQNLEAGTYIAVEDDSIGWVHIGSIRNGTPIAGTSTQDTVTVSGGNPATIDFVNFNTTAITVRKFQDNDGKLTTSADRVSKDWYLEIRSDSVTGPLIASGSGNTLTATGLDPGTYFAIEADSTDWTHMGYILDDVPVTSSVNNVSITISFSQHATLDFVNASPAYSQMYRSFTPENVANDVDNKGKVGKYVKRKPDKVQFKFNLIVGNGPNLTLKFSQEVTGVITRGKLKLDTIATFSGKKPAPMNLPVLMGDTIQIDGWGPKGKAIKAEYAWTGDKLADVTSFKLNQPRLPMPNRINALYETYTQGGFGSGLLVGVSRPDAPKSYGWVLHPKYGDVKKTLKDKTGLHTAAARGFDMFASGKPLVKQQKSLSPKKQNNHLMASMTALKLNIAASTLDKIPNGFGELIFDDGGLTSLNGLMIKEIAARGDSIMTYFTGITSQEYATLDSIISYINGAFEGSLDTIEFATKLVFKGTKRLIEVSNLRPNPSVIPTRIVADRPPDYPIPEVYELFQNYPNPFNPSTMIQFDIPEPAIVTLKIYNMLGQEVATLIDAETMDDGIQEVEFDASTMASGVYFYRLVANGIGDEEEGIVGQTFVYTKKMLLVK